MWLHSKQHTAKSWISKRLPKQHGLHLFASYSTKHDIEHYICPFRLGRWPYIMSVSIVLWLLDRYLLLWSVIRIFQDNDFSYLVTLTIGGTNCNRCCLLEGVRDEVLQEKHLLYGCLSERARWSESCVLIGYPSGQDGPICPARECEGGFKYVCPPTSVR